MTETGASRRVTSNQPGIHERLEEIVLRHQNTEFKRPFAEHTLKAFEQANEWLTAQGKPLILDSCCGVGESSLKLAAAHPEFSVIGVDRSEHRLSKQERAFEKRPDNLLMVQADLVDFWRLAVKANWAPTQHTILYPNPYPKASQVQRRWHASPVFGDLIKLGGELELRSNWRVYLEEFSVALGLYGIHSQVESFHSEEPMTAFERKYWASGQETWVCRASLTSPSP